MFPKKIVLVVNNENKGISIASNQALSIIKDYKVDCILKSDNDAFYRTTDG